MTVPKWKPSYVIFSGMNVVDQLNPGTVLFVHRDPVIFGDWALQAYRKLRVM